MKRRIKITEKQAKAIAAQDQVGNKVNSGLMHYEGGICEDADFELGPEDGAISPYYHVTNGSASVMRMRSTRFPRKKLTCHHSG